MLQGQLSRFQNSESSLTNENTSLRDKVEAANRYAIINMGLQSSLSQMQDQMNDIQKVLQTHHEKVKLLENEQIRLTETVELERREKQEIGDKLDLFKKENKTLAEKLEQTKQELEMAQLLHQEKVVVENALKKDIEDLNEKINAMDQDVLGKKLKEMEKHSLNVINQLLRTEDAIEASLTCTCCMKQINNPRILVPCGHVFCYLCCSTSSTCMDCDEHIEAIVKTDLIDNFISKQSVKKQTLLSLQKYFKMEHAS